MTRVLLLGFVLLAAACGGKSFESLCANQVPPPAACNTACDPTPGAANACPAGFHCTSDGKCDTFCTQGGNECGNGYTCTADGRCEPKGNGSGSDMEPDADCPAVHLTAKTTTPTVELLLDQSGSMTATYGNTNRWNALRDALVGPDNSTAKGVVGALADKVAFGATLYSGTSHDEGGRQVGDDPCPMLTPRADVKPARQLNNYTPIHDLLRSASPIDDTPTPESIDAIVASFANNPPAPGSPPIIVLATDGLPDTCADADPQLDPDPVQAQARQQAANQASVMAAQRAFAAGIKLFFLFVGNDQAGTHPQQMANAGAGLDPATGNAKFYLATDPAALTKAFNDIVGGVLSCDVTLNQHVGAADAPSGVVTVNGTPLTYNTDWTLDADGLTIHIQGSACDMVKNATSPTIDATFPCGTVIF